MEILLVLIIAFFVLSLILKSSRYKGKAGERKVGRKLAKLIGTIDEFRTFHDVTLRTPDGTTQIDHILLSPFGIFVIETKNLTGWIYGGEKQKTWTQVVYKKKSTFQNPIHQNYKHVKAVQNLLAVNKRFIFNVVVFAGDATFKTPMPHNIVRTKHLPAFIGAYSERLLTATEVDGYASLIQSTISTNPITENEHLINLKKNRNNPLCPKCGSLMVLRTAGRGSNKGANFWGCCKFPICRGTKNKH